MAELQLRNGRTIIYRRLQQGDEEALRKFDQDLGEESRRKFSPHAYDADTMAKIVARSERDEDRVYIALDGERVVAYFFLWWFNTDFPILGIGLADDFQGQGLGKQLMNILIDAGKAAGRQGIELTTMLDNKNAYALYEKVGFKCLGEVDNVTGDGRHVVEYHMVYPITPEGENPPKRKHEPPV